METLKDILWPIVVAGGLGRFIDFLIGKIGQERARDFLLKWWVRFDNVRWNNFGREEGLFAGHLIEKSFGMRIYSIRRMLIFLLIFLFFWSVKYVIEVIKFKIEPSFYFSGHWLDFACTLLVYAIVFSMSISFTKTITFTIASRCGNTELNNLIMFISALIINYIILTIVLTFTSPSKDYIAMILAELFEGERRIAVLEGIIWANIYEIGMLLKAPLELIPSAISRIFGYSKYADLNAFIVSTSIPSLFRFTVSIIFVGSFLIRPVIMRPVNLVWMRILESEKPVFTVIFGGAAAFATAIGEAAKHL